MDGRTGEESARSKEPGRPRVVRVFVQEDDHCDDCW